ncbi:MAG: PQQ-binding-like beta-propeller repeat protein [Anaerolineales bacterium]
MTPPTIFCPSSHLILSAARCAQCGWQRPPLGRIGEPAWQPVLLKAGLGGPGSHVFAGPAAAQGVLALPMNNREIIGLDLPDGKERWRAPLGEGLVTRQLVGDGDSILLALSDERSLESAGPGQLARLDPLSGKLSSLWQAGGHQLSSPACSETHIVVSAANSELIAFRRAAALEVAWRAPLRTFWTVAPPHIAAGSVFVCDGQAMQGEGWLKAFNLLTGKQIWSKPTQGLIPHPLASCAGQLIFQNGRKRLVAWDAASGRETWGLDFDKFYTPPVAGGGRIFFVTRGQAARDSAEHYLLKALDPTSGKLLWETPLPARVSIPPLWAGCQVYLAGEDGRLFAFDEQNGGQVFTPQQVGSDEDPPRAMLLAAEGLLVAGTYSGKVTALQVEEPCQEMEAPEAYLGRGEAESAAVALALQGKFDEAGGLYADELRDTSKAVALYAHAKRFDKAADLCARQGLLAEAEKYYEQAGDLPKQAEILLLRGDKQGAARIFASIGQAEKAADLFEQAGDWPAALELYEKLGNEEAATRVERQMPPNSQRVEARLKRLEQQGKFAEAAAEALRARLFRDAADFFQKAGQPEDELDALLKLAEEKPEEWLLERVAESARSLGRFLDEAKIREKLNHPHRTAEAYHRAAMQAERLKRADLTIIGDLYQKAEGFAAQAGAKNLERECHVKVILYLGLPDIAVQVSIPQDFEEGGFNKMKLTLYNQGHGVAKNIYFQAAGDRFEIDATSSTLRLGNLAEAESDERIIRVRPLEKQVGATVPLLLEWRWQDESGKEYCNSITADVPVRHKGEQRLGNTPQVINIGTLIQGDQLLQGDKLAEGASKQVGDRVEIQRGGGVRVTDDEQRTKPASPTCPNCKLPNDPDAKFCVHCQQPLAN